MSDDQLFLRMRVLVLAGWLNELYAACSAERHEILWRQEAEDVVSDLERQSAEWLVLVDRIAAGRPFASAGIIAQMRVSILGLGTVRRLFLGDGFSGMKRYVECLELLRVAVLEYILLWGAAKT